ncbi:adenosine kinase, partial [Psychrobacter sp. 16-Bac2893]
MSAGIQPAMDQLRQQATVNGAKIAVSFADPAVVKFAKEGLLNMLGNKVAVIFCNSEEARLFTDENEYNSAARALLEYCQIAVVTDGANGAVIAHQPNDESDIEIYDIPTPAVDSVIDTNGAGDNYAGAFLYALSQQYSLPECGRLASAVAAQVIQQLGPRLASEDYQSIAKRVLTA